MQPREVEPGHLARAVQDDLRARGGLSVPEDDRRALGDAPSRRRRLVVEIVHGETLGFRVRSALPLERNHQGLANELIERAASRANTNGRVERRDRLGRLLTFYHREAA